MGKIGVFIIDNNTIFRDGLHQSLTRTEDIEVVGDADINEEALELVKESHPEIVLVDIGLPQLTGLRLAPQIIQCLPEVSMVMLASYDNDEYLFQIIKSGAAGYLNKDATADELASAIRRIHEGEHIINETVLTRPKVAERILKQFQGLSLLGVTTETLTAPLTSRELEILSYAARGYINRQIADKLGISEQTIKNHMSSILRKLDASDRTQAVVLALHNGWILCRPRELQESLVSI